LYTTILFHPL